ncbi:MAG: DHHW family protein, partial [Butyricicoccaceae bacterium]
MQRTVTRTLALLLAGLMVLSLLLSLIGCGGSDSTADQPTDAGIQTDEDTSADPGSQAGPDAEPDRSENELPAEDDPLMPPAEDDTAGTDAGTAEEPGQTAPETPETPPVQPENPGPAAPDANGMMQLGDTWIQDPGALDTGSISGFADKLRSLQSKYLSQAGTVAYAVIPDKSHYAAGQITASLSHDAMMETLRPLLEGWTEIRLDDLLTLEDYLLTDGHWRQEKLVPTANRIAGTYGFSVSESDFSKKSQSGFGGDYSKYSGTTETICWMESRQTAAAVCDNFQNPNRTAVYDSSLLNTGSPYDLFTGGPTPLVTIRNTENTGGRRLILFRDSFGSSMAPLLLGGYSEIVLVDLRYMVSDLLPQ